MRRFLLMLVVLASALVTASPARACTCAPPDANRLLASAGAVFIGTVVDVQPVPGDQVDHHLEVDRVLTGDIPERITVRSSANSASCGLVIPPGERVGLAVDRTGGQWRGGACGTIAPDSLLAVAGGGVDEVPSDAGDGGGLSWPLAVVAVALLASIAAVGAAHMRRSP